MTDSFSSCEKDAQIEKAKQGETKLEKQTMSNKEEINETRPKHLWRDDGERFTRNENDGTYSMDNTMMDKPYRYSFEALMMTGVFGPWEPSKEFLEEEARKQKEALKRARDYDECE